LSYWAVWDEIVTSAAEINWVHGLRGYEVVDVDCLLILGPDFVQFVEADDNILSLGVFVAGNDFVVRHFPVNGTVFLVFDATVAGCVELIQVNLAATTGCSRVRLDWDGNET
jgi:hypothetical protein